MRILCDTGATCSNYFPMTLFNSLRKELLPVTQEYKHRVTLGDQSTQVPIDHKVTVDLLLINSIQDSTHETRVQVDCCVIPGFDQIILGLPILLTTLYPLFINLMEERRQDFLDQQALALAESGKFDQYSLHAILGTDSKTLIEELQAPLLNTPDSYNYTNHKATDFPQAFETQGSQVEECEEDRNIPDPCMFTDALHYMEMSVEDATQEYLDTLRTHVDPAFAAATKVMDLLKGPKGIKCFVPTNWEGVKGVEIEMEFADNFPKQHVPKARPINPKLMESFTKEFNRLCKYHLQPSTSTTASPCVIAPKATHPYIRFCGDYVWLNDYIPSDQHPLVNVQLEMAKLAQFSVYIDLDMVNAFHQLRLGPRTMQALSVTTPLGHVEPRFLPEGVKPASAMLQKTVENIFKGFEDFTLIIFDNFLVLANDYDDAYAKLELILDRCIEYNLFLKPSKSFYGVKQVKFFGYQCTKGKYCLDQDRKQGIMDISMPTMQVEMQRFLGSALFFKSFIPHYASLSAPLNDMTHKDFDWKKTEWTVDYITHFETLKVAISNAMTLYHPDYNLEWLVRSDASELGVGGVLYQIKDGILQPISFTSWKFTKPARSWSTTDQEAYAIFHTVMKFSYFLRGKRFTVETDHYNLIFMRNSIVNRVQRQCAYLQSFDMFLRHIAGIKNVTSDMISRAFPAMSHILQTISWVTAISPSEKSMLDQVHGSRIGHHGEARTMMYLKKFFPEAKISQQTVREFLDACWVCQKTRYKASPSIPPIMKSITYPEHRSAVDY